MDFYVRIVRYVKPYLGRLIIAVLCLLGASGAQLILPWIIKDVIDDVFANKDVFILNIIICSIVVLFILRGFFVYAQGYLMSYVSQKAIIDLREDFFRKIQTLPLAYYDKRTTGSIMSHFSSDIGGLQSVMVTSGVDFITESFVLVFSIVSMFLLNWKLSLLTFIAAPLIAFAVDRLGRKIRKIGGRVQERTAEMNSLLQEILSGIRVVKSFARENFELERFHNQNDRNFSINMKSVRVSGLLTPIVEFLAALGVAAVFWYGGMSVIRDEMTAGALIAFLFYAVNLSNPLKRISRTYAELQRSFASAERVFSVMDLAPAVADKPNAKNLEVPRGRVIFDRVSFEYLPGQPVLSDISFIAEPGQVIALVGASGAGKSTIANLLPRFYDVTAGAITIDGQDVRDVTQKSLRSQIGIVPQETMLFSGSVRENIRYGRLEASEEEIIAAAKAARVDEFVQKLPQGYDSAVGERGVSLSGGQRQRVAIARAILKNPQILILDEATSALDVTSEKLVQEALEVLMKGRTSFVIAHRLSTIFNADCILVMENGRIIERGRHEELLAESGVYAKLYLTQFKEEAKGEEEFAPIDL